MGGLEAKRGAERRYCSVQVAPTCAVKGHRFVELCATFLFLDKGCGVSSSVEAAGAPSYAVCPWRSKVQDGQPCGLSFCVPRLDLDLYLSFSEGVALETIGDGIAILLFDHFGMLSRCPAFPEIIAPTLPHLRRQSFKCPSERLRKQLRTFVAAAETTMTEVRTRREALTECTKLFVFESTSLSKARATFRRGT